jgi:hypothetical protein
MGSFQLLTTRSEIVLLVMLINGYPRVPSVLYRRETSHIYEGVPHRERRNRKMALTLQDAG